MAATVLANGASDGLTDLGLMDRGVIEAHGNAIAAQLDGIQREDHIDVVGAHGHTLPIDQSPVQREMDEALSPVSEPVVVEDLRYSSGVSADTQPQDEASPESSTTVEDILGVGTVLAGGGPAPTVEEQIPLGMESGAIPKLADEQMSGKAEPEPEPTDDAPTANDRKRPAKRKVAGAKAKRARTEASAAPKKMKKKKKPKPKKRKASESVMVVSETEGEPAKKRARSGKKGTGKSKTKAKTKTAAVASKAASAGKSKKAPPASKTVASSSSAGKPKKPRSSGASSKKEAGAVPKKAAARPKRTKAAPRKKAAPNRNKFADVEADVGAAEEEGPAEKVAAGPTAYTKPGVNPEKDLPMGGRGDSSSDDDSIVNDDIYYMTESDDEDVSLSKKKKKKKKNLHDGSASFYRRMSDSDDELMLGLSGDDASGAVSAAMALGKRPTGRRRLTQIKKRKQKGGAEKEEEWTSDTIPQIVSDPEHEWPAYKEMSARIADKLRAISRCGDDAPLVSDHEVAALTKSLFAIARHLLTPEAASANAEQMIEIISKTPASVSQCAKTLWTPVFKKLRGSFEETNREFLRDLLQCTMADTFDIAPVKIGDDEEKALKCMWTGEAIAASEAVWRVAVANPHTKHVVLFYVKRSPGVPNLYVQALCALRSIYAWPAVFQRHISLWQERKHVSESMSADMRMLEFVKADASVEVVAEALAAHFASKHVVLAHIL